MSVPSTALVCVKCGASDAAVQHVALREAGVVIVAICKACRHCWEIEGKTPLLRTTSENENG